MKKIISIFFSMILCFLLIDPVNVDAATVKLNKTTLTLYTNDSYTLKLSGTTKNAKWTTNNKSVVTVSTKGVVKAIKAGSATITATVSTKKYTCKVTVPVIKINKTSLKVDEGKTYTLGLSGTKKTVTWSSSNTTIATVSNKGVVKGIKAGNATITAFVSNKKYSCAVTVNGVFSATKALAAMVKTEHNLGNQVVVILENKYNSPFYIQATAVFYDSNGKILKTSYEDNGYFESGKKCALWFCGPYDSEYNDIKYSSYKITYQILPVMSSQISTLKNISVNSNIAPDNKVIAEVKNNGVSNADYTLVSIVFYKDGKVIGYDDTYAFVDEPGSTDYLNFYFPEDLNNDAIIPDSYEIYVNYSYSYTN